MTRARFVRVSAVMLGLLSIVGLPFLPGCGEEEPDPTLLENAPASKSKDSMDYYRNKMKKGRTR